MTQLTAHFTSEEMACPHCKQSKMQPEFMAKLEQLRVAYGKPITINSGYRCPEHNKKVGGAPNSYHMQGRAVDIAVPNKAERYKLVKIAMQLGFGGCEISPKHLHVDNRDQADAVMIILDESWKQL